MYVPLRLDLLLYTIAHTGFSHRAGKAGISRCEFSHNGNSRQVRAPYFYILIYCAPFVSDFNGLRKAIAAKNQQKLVPHFFRRCSALCL